MYILLDLFLIIDDNYDWPCENWSFEGTTYYEGTIERPFVFEHALSEEAIQLLHK